MKYELASSRVVRKTNDEGKCSMCGGYVHIGDKWIYQEDLEEQCCSMMCLEDARDKHEGGCK